MKLLKVEQYFQKIVLFITPFRYDIFTIVKPSEYDFYERQLFTECTFCKEVYYLLIVGIFHKFYPFFLVIDLDISEFLQNQLFALQEIIIKIIITIKELF